MLTAVRDFGLEDHVRFLGAVPQEQVLAALQTADLFLMSSLSEGLNTATLDAMAAGRPVVVTDVGGMREAVTDGVEGRLVPSRTPDALADAVLQLASDPELRVAMGRRGHRRVVQDFDSRETARALRAQYQRLLDERAGPRTVGRQPSAEAHHALP